MKKLTLYRHSTTVPLAANGSVVSIGNFDGVHRGHQEVLCRARNHANRLGVPLVVLTFHPHPRKVLTPERAPSRLTTFADKLRAMQELGVDAVYAVRFTRNWARTTPEDFVRNLIHGTLKAREVIVGYDFAFGRDRSAGLETLATLGRELQYGLEVVPAYEVNGVVASSTEVRALLAAGEADKAATLLGRAYSLRVDGKNDVKSGLVLLKNGEYAAQISYHGGLLPAKLRVDQGRIVSDIPSGPCTIHLGQPQED